MTEPKLHSTQEYPNTYTHLQPENESQPIEEYLEEQYRELTEKVKETWDSYHRTSEGVHKTRLRSTYLKATAERDQVIQVHYELQRLGKIPSEKELPPPEELLTKSHA